jgi:hypothetical protein
LKAKKSKNFLLEFHFKAGYNHVMNANIHPIQIVILRKLLFAKKLKYSQMKPSEMENSHFVFHLNKLLTESIVIKDDGFYFLSQHGKELANRMNSTELTFTQMPKTTTMLCVRKKVDDEFHYLIMTRTKNPFYDHQCFPTHKVWFDHSIAETALE